MKIFVFEYITGGGLSDQPLPEGLVREGNLMLRALINDLMELPEIDLYITRDVRLSTKFFSPINNINLIQVGNDASIKTIFKDLLQLCDAVWPIAPETQGILADYSAMVEASNTTLLNSSAETVTITGNKLTTLDSLSKFNIPVVSGTKLSDYKGENNHPSVIKPIDGVGCDNGYLIADRVGYEKISSKIFDKRQYLIQPFIEGRSISLSCLFKNRRAWLICCNEQKINIVKQQFSLTACKVNISIAQLQQVQEIIKAIAEILPGLWGYVGIDLIEASNGPMVLEINPRLTTSYAGINQALGANIAEHVIQMLKNDPIIKQTKNKTATVVA